MSRGRDRSLEVIGRYDIPLLVESKRRYNGYVMACYWDVTRLYRIAMKNRCLTWTQVTSLFFGELNVGEDVARTARGAIRRYALLEQLPWPYRQGSRAYKGPKSDHWIHLQRRAEIMDPGSDKSNSQNF